MGIPFQLRIDRKLELTTDMHLFVNDSEYIEFPLSQCIPKSQYQKLLTDISAIETEFGQYVAGFMKAAKKKRIAREPLYRESSLINFMSELGLADTDITL